MSFRTKLGFGQFIKAEKCHPNNVFELLSLMTITRERQSHHPERKYKILTLQMMEAISAAADRSGGTFYLSFLSDGKTNVAIQTGHALFELGNGYEDAEELRRLTDIIDTLNVKAAPDDNHW